jgi:Ca2+/Na+ antiporter
MVSKNELKRINSFKKDFLIYGIGGLLLILINKFVIVKLNNKQLHALNDNFIRLGLVVLLILLALLGVNVNVLGFLVLLYALIVYKYWKEQKNAVHQELNNTLNVIQEAEKINNTPSPNDVELSKSNKNGEFEIEEPKEVKENTENKTNESLGLPKRDNSNLYVSNNDLKKQNKGLVSKDQLHNQYAISLQEEDIKHNSNSYKVNNNSYVIGELLSEGSELVFNEPMKVENVTNAVSMENTKHVDVMIPSFEPFENPTSVFTSEAQFKDAQNNEVECCAPKEPVAVKCFSNDGIRSAKNQYSAQGLGDQPDFPVGYSA